MLFLLCHWFNGEKNMFLLEEKIYSKLHNLGVYQIHFLPLIAKYIFK